VIKSPNWCEVELDIYGSFDDLTDFANNAKSVDEPLSFASLVPEPNYEGYLDCEVTDGMPDWYNWRIDNWGVKWDIAEVQYYNGPDSLGYSFETPWGPPDVWVATVSKLYPSLKFVITYAEMGMDFGGKIEYINGTITKEESGSYNDFAACPIEYDDNGNYSEV
jgi:hypothetical protein